MQPTVLLFDIDGTLISSGSVARRCIQQAFAERYGRSDTLAASFGGMTDRAIVREALGPLRPDLQGAALEMEIDAALDAYLAVLEAEAGAATSGSAPSAATPTPQDKAKTSTGRTIRSTL